MTTSLTTEVATKQIMSKDSLADDLRAVGKHRDKQAYTRLFDHFAPLIRSFCLSANPGASLQADDIVQEVMLKVWRKAHSYNPKSGAPSTWIYTMARNTRIDCFRKNGKHNSNIDPSFLWETIEDEAPSPFEVAHASKRQEFLSQQLSELPDNQKQVIIKMYIEGKSHEDIAEELNAPLGTIKSRIRLAMKKLSLLANK